MTIAIIGGGVIGLAIGWRLAQRGAAVTIFERATAGQGSSNAAAGMLAAACETEPGEAALGALNRASLALWPDFAAELEAASGIGVGLRREGTLLVALNRDDAAKLRHDMAFQKSQGIALEWLTPAEAREREPYLAPGLAGAVFSPGDIQVDNRRVVAALVEAFLRAGGVLHDHAPIERIETAQGRVCGVATPDGMHPADTVVLAAGAWSGAFDLPIASPPVQPVKGQMLAVRMDAAAPLLRHVVWAPRAYLVPRADGRLIVGATVEERGFDTRITAGGLYALLDGAWRALPGIEELPVIETWVGFRPGSRDDAPILGPSALPGLQFATGHHRNGILLTPVTADAMAATILSGQADARIAGFGADRFDRLRSAA
ncbi:glycine oxidase ThiO [Acidiphilium sp. AL]|uniref:Glycine oxidase ThiO n=1 Tax=Acidiphilium iwatense TaxID=768198 RepID=A0ABS9DWM7_9PROT|nr:MULTISPECIES: glycine oxidase ThiO [Acidiphilium]MCF3947094.1 glycine oxidase ThiO [Acidiphilium iwatense]MCU4160496.1 glycine oxidase ThiO [Acidiphilium sp. AL]